MKRRCAPCGERGACGEREVRARYSCSEHVDVFASHVISSLGRKVETSSTHRYITILYVLHYKVKTECQPDSRSI